MRPLRRVLLLALLASLSLAQAQERPSLRMADMKQISQTLFEASGVLEGAPYDVQFTPFSAAGDIHQALNAQAVDIGTSGDAPLVFALSAGAPQKAVAVIRAFSSGLEGGYRTAVVARKDDPMNSVADLKGKRIATTKGSTGQYLTLRALHEAGMKSSDVQFVFLPPAECRSMLLKGTVDAWAAWPPFVGVARYYDQAKVVIDSGKVHPTLVFLVASERALTQKRELLEDFLRRYEQANQWAKRNPEAYAAAESKATGISAEVYKLLHADSTPTIDNIGPGDVSELQAIADTFAAEGIIAKPVKVGEGLLQGYYQAAPQVSQAGATP